jgi:hypothetical protein
VVVDLAQDPERCLKRLAPIAKKSAKSLLNPAAIAPFIAKTVFQNAKTKFKIQINHDKGVSQNALFI